LREERQRRAKQEEDLHQKQQDDYNRLLYSRSEHLVRKFLEIAETKVSILDDCGDENWEALRNEIRKCLGKIMLHEGKSEKEVREFLKNDIPMVSILDVNERRTVGCGRNCGPNLTSIIRRIAVWNRRARQTWTV